MRPTAPSSALAALLLLAPGAAFAQQEIAPEALEGKVLQAPEEEKKKPEEKKEEPAEEKKEPETLEEKCAVLAEEAKKKAEAEAKKKAEAEKPKDGWHPSAKVGATFSLSHSDNVVGATNGLNIQLGAIFEGGLKLLQGQHEWENTLNMQYTAARTPNLDLFVKTVDNFDYRSLYTYKLQSLKWIGPFVRMRLQAQMTRGDEIRNEDIAVQRTFRSGRVETDALVRAQRRIELTDPFEPMTITESAGAFALPFHKKDFKLKTRLGVGLQHLVVRDGFRLADNGDTPDVLELQQLQGSSQAGGEFEVQATGAIAEAVSWRAGLELFVPFFSTLDGVDLLDDAMTTEITGGISMKLAKWASIDYTLMARRFPLVVTGWQVQNGIVLTTSFSL